MSDDPQVVSISSAPPLSPDEIARKAFPASRRGVDGEAVRLFLGKVATELRDLMEREAALRLRVVEAERRAEDPELDEATLTRAIGIETAKILWTAHDAAKNVVTTAEQRAAELLAEAESVFDDQVAAANAEGLAIRATVEQEVAEQRSLAQAEAESLTTEAHADAVELLDATKEECRRMVAEARELRNRTLADLAGRRRALHIQLEELRTGKDSLLRVVDGVALSVEVLRERLASAEDVARVEAEEAGQRAAQEPEPQDLEELEQELVAAAGGVAAGGVGKDEVVTGGLAAVLEEGAEGGGSGDVAEGESSAEAPGQAGSTASRRSVDELFARIRASRAAEEAAEVPDGGPEAAGWPAAAATVTAPPAGAPTPAAAGIYDIEAVSAAESGAGTSVRAGPSEAVEAAEAEARLGAERSGKAGDRGDTGDSAGPAATEPGDITQAIEIVQMPGEPKEAPSEGAGDAAGDGGKTEGAGEAEEAAGEAEGAAGDGADGAAGKGANAEVVGAEIAAAEAAIEAEGITEPDVEALARRDHLLGPITAKLGRTLKRALQDDQNELLNALRQASGKPVLDELMPPNVQRERLVTAAEEQLARAYGAGAAFLVAGDAVEGPSVTAVAPTEFEALETGTLLAAELAADLTSLLRQRIEQSLSELDGGLEGSAEAAGAAYREWKGTRVEGLAGDFATQAFAAGELAVLGSLSEGEAPFVRWVVEDDDAGGSCPDCDDNSLAGPQLPGADFPTGHVRPPVHPGCRCLLVPVRS